MNSETQTNKLDSKQQQKIELGWRSRDSGHENNDTTIDSIVTELSHKKKSKSETPINNSEKETPQFDNTPRQVSKCKIFLWLLTFSLAFYDYYTDILVAYLW
eukprot:342282_1